jgi:hypothetical protein
MTLALTRLFLAHGAEALLNFPYVMVGLWAYYFAITPEDDE